MALPSVTRQNDPMSRIKRILVLLLWPALLGMPGVALAYIDVTRASTTVTINWAGGDISRDVNFCTVSVDGTLQEGMSPLPYDVRITSLTGAMLLDGPGADLPLTAQWTDLVAGTTQTLVHGVATALTNTGVIDPCPAGKNGRVTFTLLASDLYTRAPGTYSAHFRLRVRNQAAGVRRDVAQVTLNVVVPAVVHLSGLDSLSLGTWTGAGNMSGSDSLCVFINSGVLYSVTATGSGIGGAFSVSNGSVPVAFDANWNDGSGVQSLLPGVVLGNRANANTTSIDCAGGTGNNAVFSVEVPAANLQAVPAPGTFSGTVTLTVQAQ
jgi:hypothetical protein